MLDSIRSNAQSFGVKLAFGLIILVFVFWGVGSFTDSSPANIIAKVNGEPILAQQFEMAYQNAEESLLRSNPGLTREMLDTQKKALGREVLQSLIQQSLLRQEAARLGFSVSPLELRQAVEQIKAFQNDQGKFDAQAYIRVLEAQRMTPAQFEKDMSDQFLSEKLFAAVSAPAWVAPDEARKLHDFLRERRAVDYIFVPAADFRSDAAIPETEVSRYYEEHRQSFAVPQQVEISYILVRPEKLVKAESISEADARRWYENNKSRFTVKAEDTNQPGHIRAFEDVQSEVQAALAEEMGSEKLQDVLDTLIADNILGKSLAESATAHGLEERQSGLLTQAELMQKLGLKPEGAAAIMEAGDKMPIDAALECADGYMIVRVSKLEPASTRPLKDVRDDIINTLASDRALKAAMEKADTIRKELQDGPLPEGSIARWNIKSVPSVERGGTLADFGSNNSLNSAIFTALPATWLPVAYTVNSADTGSGALLCRVSSILPPDDEQWKSVEEILQNAVKSERAEGLARLFMQELFSRAKVEVLNMAQVERVNM